MFSFGFNEDDLNGDDNVVNVTIPESRVEKLFNVAPVSPPKCHILKDLLTSLKDLKISFTRYVTPANNVVYKRELFDIKHQVMTEDNEEMNQLLIDNNSSDLNKDSYEGGFKVWECSYDLIDHLGDAKEKSVVEIGGGTSLPSCFILKNRFVTGDKSGLQLVLSDFNYDVVRLVTLPNILINWISYKVPSDEDHGELTLSDMVIDEFLSDLNEFNIELQFISGSWSNEFLDLVKDTKFDLVLSCETIYSLDSLSVLGHMINELTKSSPQLLSLVAAKNYYFGVGGSIVEFIKVLQEYGLSTNTVEVNSQLKRSIIEVRSGK